MAPTDFPEATRTYGKPVGWTDEQCSPLRVCEARDDDGFDLRISCWKPSWRDRLRVLFGRPVWLHIFGQAQPPVRLDTDVPFRRAA